LDLARLWEQVKELWAKPIGKAIFGGVAAFIVIVAVIAFTGSRTQYQRLGTFDGQSASQVQQKLQEQNIPFRQADGDPYTFEVDKSKWSQAKLVIAELNLDPESVKWASDSWATKTDWMSTEFDKRRLLVEQLQTDLSRAIASLTAVNRARVTLTVPNDRLFKEDQTKPKASVLVEPKPGQKLTTSVVEAIMSTVAGAVDGLDKKDVVVVDTASNSILSDSAFASKSDGKAAVDQTADRLKIQTEFEERWQKKLTAALEQVVGPKNVSVIVTPVFDWETVMKNSTEYTGANGGNKGIPVSEQTKNATSQGQTVTATTPPAGTTPNAEAGPPTYPGAIPGTTQPLSAEQVERITNYLVSETKTVSEKPGGGIKSISVGIMVNEKYVTPQTERAMNAVIATSLGNNAQVQVAAIPFNNSFEDVFKTTETPTRSMPTQWLWWLIGAALALGGIAFFLSALRPKRPVLEPVFTGPEAGMMGGIPVSDLEMVLGGVSANQAVTDEKRTPQTADELMQLAPEEIALLGDDFLQQLGVDPAKVRMKEKVEKIARANPEAVANLIKTWIAEE
jgi:flagellar M-ring protein FliF